MTEQQQPPAEQPPAEQPRDRSAGAPPADIDTPPTTADFYVEPDEDDQTGAAVYDVTLGQFVSGVMSKSDASKAAKSMAEDKEATTYGHELMVRVV